MPTYEYACTSCGQHVEAVQSFSDDPLTTCPHCGGPLRKVFAPVGIVLKGSGFYKTDSRAAGGNGAKAGKDRAESGGSGDSGGGSSGDGGAKAGSATKDGGGSSGGDKGSGAGGSGSSGSSGGTSGSGSSSGSTTPAKAASS